MLEQVNKPGIDQGVRGVGRHPREIAQIMLGEGITGRTRHCQDAKTLLVGEQWNGDKGSGLMLRVRRLEAGVRPRIPDQDWFPMRQGPAGNSLTDLEARHFADRDRAVPSGFDLELLLEFVDQGQGAPLEADQLRGRVQYAIRSEEHTSELQSPDHLV